MTNTIGVIGCGWLGFSLAKTIVAAGYTVKGTTTSSEKLEKLTTANIDSYVIKLHETNIEGDISGFLSNVDSLIINIPPRLRKNANGNYVAKIELLLAEIKKATLKKVIFISSTSVYGNISGEVTEETIPQPKTASGKQLLECENLLLKQTNFKTSVIRFGGLIGPERHPITMLSGRVGLTNGEEPVNLIHRDDCIHMIMTILKNDYWGQVFNGVYPLHPTKKEYYTKEAIKRNLEVPKYNYLSYMASKKIIINKNFLVKKHMLYTSII